MFPSKNGIESKTEDGALYSNEDEYIEIPKECLFHNYSKVYKQVGHLVRRSYERPHKWFMLTFKPFIKTYEKDINFYISKGFDHVRKKVGKVDAFIMTREINAAKVHINMLCCTTRALDIELHEKQTNKYFIYCQPCIDRHCALEYILKESRTRFFYEYIDYQYSK